MVTFACNINLWITFWGFDGNKSSINGSNDIIYSSTVIKFFLNYSDFSTRRPLNYFRE
ncbi:unnamed protein product [Tenebrio molitor]|nr:unnamed protein product [Tenebrio molitor]